MAEASSRLASTRRGSRVWFLADGVVTGANALAYLALHAVLPGLLGSAPPLYLTAGGILAVVTVGLLAVAFSATWLRVLAATLVVVNLGWAGASFATALLDPFGMTAVGIAWAVAQGVVVLAFGVLQLRSMRATR